MKLPDPQADPDVGRSAGRGLTVQDQPDQGGIEMSSLPIQPTPASPATASESPTNTRPGLIPINPGIVAAEPSALPTTPDPAPASASPIGVAVAAPAPPHSPTEEASPAQVAPLRGVITGPNGEQAVFLSDEEFDNKFNQETHTLHIGVASICSGLVLIICAGIGLVGGGLLGGIGLAVLGAVLLAVSAAVGTGAIWIVSKLFNEDFGTFHILMLRAAAVVSAQVVALLGFIALVGPGLGMLVALPAQFFLAAWLLGMDALQAFVFVVVMKIIEWLLFIFVAMSIASAVMS